MPPGGRTGGGDPREATTPSSPAHRPRPLCDYALLADGERGALLGPEGDLVWLCVPGWADPAVFSELIGGAGAFQVCPEDPWRVSEGSYRDGSLIWTGHWTLADSVIECQDALAVPADAHRAVLLRRIRAVRGTAVVTVRLTARGGYGADPPLVPHRTGPDTWEAGRGVLRERLRGLGDARLAATGALTARLTVPEGERRDLVLELSDRPLGPPVPPDEAWRATDAHWNAAVPDCTALPAARDVRRAYAVLTGLTSPRTGAMVAAATTSLPEHAGSERDYDYRYAWLRDQCYAGLAVAAHGPHPLTDAAVRVATARVLADGDRLRPAYRVDGGPVPDESTLPLSGYPGAADLVGNRAGAQFQLDSYGEILELLAAAARQDRLDRDGIRAAHTAVAALRANWSRPEAGLWELAPAWWTHSRLAAVCGLQAAARDIRTHGADRWRELADTILAETRRRCTHPSGRWQRAADDPRPDAALLRPLASSAWPAGAPLLGATRRAVERELGDDGFVYRFHSDDATELGGAEGAFLLCGFFMSAACRAEGRPVAAARWFERTRAATGPAGLFSEEFDVDRRRLRGNLPQAFVHALLLENAVRTASGPGGVRGVRGARGSAGVVRHAR
ncbi:glycoside hydrolase family 15 protein [Streptomyces sp. NPDC057411]|uniref:glycoside hydrolase family 15 protein n=1 Tax=unclassified Streptomyces TaxID=2593676 RepID=UPI003628AA89